MPDTNKLINALVDHLRLITAASVGLSVVATMMWWAFGPRFEDVARELVGTAELKDLVIEQGVRLEQNTDAIQGLTDRVTAMEPAPSVAEYDILRSDIEETCRPGASCSYIYRVRRTDEGLSCGVPTAQHVLVDASGTTFFPQASSGNRRAQRLADEWSIVSSSFIVPRNVALGIAEFSLQITYPDCDRDALGRIVVTEESPHLIFEIVRE